MESRDVKILLLLEAIDKEGCQSQRELSRKLNISLGLVNAFIKNLSVQGLFKTIKLPSSKVKYILTPKGISEKSNLTVRYISSLCSVYKETKKRLQLRFDSLFKSGILKIVMYGANELSEIACALSYNPSQEVVAIIDNGKEGQEVNGVKVCSENRLLEISYDTVFITETDNISKVKMKLMNMSVPEHKIASIC